MAQEVNCSVAKIAQVAPRAIVPRAGRVFCGDPPGIVIKPLGVRIKQKSLVINVKSWDPATGEIGVPLGHSALVNFESVGSSPDEIFYDVAADFLNGTFSYTAMISDDIGLGVALWLDDFEDDTIGSAPAGWNWVGGGGMDVQDDPSGRRCLQGSGLNVQGTYQWTTAGDSTDVIVRALVMYTATDQEIGPCAILTGSGSTCRGYWCRATNSGNRVDLYRWTGSGSTTWIAWGNSGVSFSNGQYFNVAYRTNLNALGTTRYHYFKIWGEGASEPADWIWLGSESTHLGPGYSGMGYKTSLQSGARKNWVDEFETKGFNPVYFTSGDWISPWHHLDDVGRYSSARITWTETVPEDTSATVYVKRGYTGSWVACTNGALLPGFTLDDALTNEVLQFKVSLATSDQDVTPLVSDLKLVFDPADLDSVSIDIGGLTAEPGAGLVTWGKRIVSGGAPAEAYDDLWAAGNVGWAEFFKDVPVPVVLKMGGVSVSEILWYPDAERAPYESGILSGDVFWFLYNHQIASGRADHQWTAWAQEYRGGKFYEWTAYDLVMGMHADGRYWIAVVRIDDHPGSLIVGSISLEDHPGSLLVYGTRLADHPGSCLVQGVKINDQPGSLLVAERFLEDHPGSVVVAVRAIDDQPGSCLVYAVNREGHIEWDVVRDETWADLLAKGWTRS